MKLVLNRLDIKCGSKSAKFKSEKTALLFTHLLKKSLNNEETTFSEVQCLIESIQPDFSLSRMTMRRFIEDLEDIINVLGLPLLLKYSTRTRTVGP